MFKKLKWLILMLLLSGLESHATFSVPDRPPEISSRSISSPTSHPTFAHFALFVVSSSSDPSGSVEAAYEYSPFGELTSSSGAMANENPFRFSTKYWDIETGLGYWGMRYYHPDLGRWLSRDPLGEEGGLLLYGFVGNDPVGGVDLLGLDVFRDLDRERGVLTLHYLVMYHAADGESIDAAKYAGEHQRALSDWFSSQTKGMKYTSAQGDEFAIELNLIIMTESDIPEMLRSEYPTWHPPEGSHPGDPDFDAYKSEYDKKSSLCETYSANRWMYENDAGFFQHVRLTEKLRASYNAGEVPVMDPEWPNMSHLELLAHEILGHGMGCTDEYNVSSSLPWYALYKEATGQPPEPDSIMYGEVPNLRGRLRLYPRHLDPALYKRSNHPYTGPDELIRIMRKSGLREIHDMGDLNDPVYRRDKKYQHEQLLRILER